MVGFFTVLVTKMLKVCTFPYLQQLLLASCILCVFNYSFFISKISCSYQCELSPFNIHECNFGSVKPISPLIIALKETIKLNVSHEISCERYYMTNPVLITLNLVFCVCFLSSSPSVCYRSKMWTRVETGSKTG